MFITYSQGVCEYKTQISDVNNIFLGRGVNIKHKLVMFITYSQGVCEYKTQISDVYNIFLGRV